MMWFFSLESVCPKTEAHDLAASPVHSGVGLEGLPSWVLAPKTVQGRGMGKMCSLHGQLPREREKRESQGCTCPISPVKPAREGGRYRAQPDGEKQGI